MDKQINKLIDILNYNDLDYDIDNGYINIRYYNHSIDTQLCNPKLISIIEAFIGRKLKLNKSKTLEEDLTESLNRLLLKFPNDIHILNAIYYLNNIR